MTIVLPTLHGCVTKPEFSQRWCHVAMLWMISQKDDVIILRRAIYSTHNLYYALS